MLYFRAGKQRITTSIKAEWIGRLSKHHIPIYINIMLTFTISVNVNQLSCYEVPSLRDLKATGKAENQATRKSPCTYLINLLQVYIHEQIDPEKGQTSEPLVSFLPGR